MSVYCRLFQDARQLLVILIQPNMGNAVPAQHGREITLRRMMAARPLEEKACKGTPLIPQGTRLCVFKVNMLPAIVLALRPPEAHAIAGRCLVSIFERHMITSEKLAYSMWSAGRFDRILPYQSPWTTRVAKDRWGQDAPSGKTGQKPVRDIQSQPDSMWAPSMSSLRCHANSVT